METRKSPIFIKKMPQSDDIKRLQNQGQISKGFCDFQSQDFQLMRRLNQNEENWKLFTKEIEFSDFMRIA